MSHFYFPDGKPCFEVPNKSKPGETRPTTIADARKLGLIPSVTTVLAYRARPELDTWKQEQAILAALTLSRMPGETDTDFCKRIIKDSQEEGKKAADKGTLLHDYIEKYVSKLEVPTLPSELNVLLPAVNSFLDSNKFFGISELHTACQEYAGTIDFVGTFNEKPCIIDFKTTKTKAGEKIKPHYEWKLQLAAYMELANKGVCNAYNIVISTTEPGRIEVVEYTKEEIVEAYKVFHHILMAYRNEKGLING
jgi:CRISPR/Cas system-associated exonuclease Cas4 (RecB family)